VLAIGTCLTIIGAAGTQWKAPLVLSPLLRLGRNSYEVYLTHMFVVFSFFGLFLRAGKPLHAVSFLFLSVILMAGLLGELVARLYSEPMNRLLRDRWGQAASAQASAKLVTT